MPDTTIPIDSDVRDRLRGRKEGSETYSDVIVRLLNATSEEYTNEEYEQVFDPMFDLKERWGITMEEAEMYLERVGYLEQ